MWKPPERIRYKPHSGNWPDADAAKDSLLFQPATLGRLEIQQRTWVPAMVPWRATEDGFVTPEVIAWYRRFAEGRPGAIVVEATGIRDVPSGPLLRIGDDRFIDGLRELVNTVRDASNGETRLLIQLIDFMAIRRRPDPKKYFERFLQITGAHRRQLGMQHAADDVVRSRLAELSDHEREVVLSSREMDALNQGFRERVTDVQHAHIRNLPEELPGIFAGAARRAESAGFDGVELHYAHAYTMASFLSALNTRKDGYGGERHNRIRLPLEVYHQVRATVGESFAVGCRFLAEECIEGGNGIADTVYFGVEFARAGMDFLSLSRGGKFEDAKQPRIGEAAYPYTGPSGYECMPQYLSDARGPFGRNVPAASQIRAAIRQSKLETPLIVAGGMHSFEQAEAILQAGEADVIGFARQALADPDWFRKVITGRGSEVRLCEYTNYCEGLDQKHKQVTCQLWDRLALDEPGVMKSKDGRRRLVAPPWRGA